jgi:hypothetical protein
MGIGNRNSGNALKGWGEIKYLPLALSMILTAYGYRLMCLISWHTAHHGRIIQARASATQFGFMPYLVRNVPLLMHLLHAYALNVR